MNGNKRGAVTDAEPSRQTPASKRPKIGEGDDAGGGGNKHDLDPPPPPPPSSAANRFFHVPELVKVVAEYVCRERVDLISLAAVCKGSRMPALQVWATHLDVPLDAAEKRFQLFDRHEALIDSIRFLRIRAGVNEYARAFQDASGGSHPGAKLWSAIFRLFALISSVKGQERGPFIDLSFFLRDARRIHDLFRWIAPAGRVVAIRLCLTDMVDNDAYSDRSDSEAEVADKKDDDKNDDHDEASEDSSDADSDEGSVKWTERKQQDAEVIWMSSWLALSELIEEIRMNAKANGGPGLQIFQLGNRNHSLANATQWLHWPSPIPMLFWSSLASNASSTLSEFSLMLSETDELASILDLLTLPKLETFSLISVGPLDIDRLDAFLSRHLHLEALSVVVEDDDHVRTLKLQQTFPNLRWLEVDCNPPSEKRVFRFIKRHSSIKGIHAPVVIEWAAEGNDLDDPTLIYDQVRTLFIHDLKRYEEIVNGGGRPSHVFLVPDSCGGHDMVDLVSSGWWLGRQEVAHALTCLEFNYRGHTLNDLIWSLRFAADRKALPNLTELSVYQLKPLDEKDLETLFAALGSAPALRVLRICEWSEHELEEAEVFRQNDAFFYNADEMLVNCLFPAAFEYFQWTGLNNLDPNYFRFLPTHDETAPTPTPDAASTKRGRLQRIPSIFRARISPVGVWDAPFHPIQASAILDHTGVVPFLAL
ncbi:unnamed protein product [Tilletia controversa]|uniref:Uncharacterized protein n=1 Tax=Tilletia controversa TaxID=13291 RepID=A0A8X7MW69_9BASI|nr:hypothetical protein CF328_g367 [Tilletia controversa]KAE8251680.1 hypothetical protein A4X06_0g2583 [Tilletia controversa]CAD6938920.1 unnamed protein product [Tilletia controversa]CAD6966885.1 unnamed protein product [Tilletia controversa]